MSTQKFSDMPIGAEFVLDGDTTGEFGDLIAYKLSDSQAFMLGCGAVHAGRIGTVKCYGEYVDLSFNYKLTGNVRDVHTTYTDLERVALTLADQHNAHHPALIAWCEAVKNDPNDIRSLGEFAWGTADQPAWIRRDEDGTPVEDQGDIPTLREECDRLGYAFPSSRYDGDCHLFSLIFDGTPEGEYKQGEVTKQYLANGGRYDAPLVSLLSDVVEYRERGRVSGDHSHDINGLGSTLVVVRTSLAAEIVNYHKRIRGLDARD